MHHSDCKLLFEAGKALLVKSGLVCWDEHAFIFAPKYQSNDDTAFENWWKKAFHCEFGRYIAWVLFSVGSENLVKAACLCNGVVPKPESTEGRPWGQLLKKPAGAALNLG